MSACGDWSAFVLVALGFACGCGFTGAVVWIALREMDLPPLL